MPRGGISGSSEYSTWSNMTQRCYNPKSTAYRWYGARGIGICPEWRGPGGFRRFLAYMGPKPTPAHSIDRLDNSKGYEPGNVRWASPRQQAANHTASERRAAVARGKETRQRRRSLLAWKRRGTLYWAKEMSAICRDVRDALVERFGEPTAPLVKPSDFQMESFYCEGDYSAGNFHTDGVAETYAQLAGRVLSGTPFNPYRTAA